MYDLKILKEMILLLESAFPLSTIRIGTDTEDLSSDIICDLFLRVPGLNVLVKHVQIKVCLDHPYAKLILSHRGVFPSFGIKPDEYLADSQGNAVGWVSALKAGLKEEEISVRQDSTTIKHFFFPNLARLCWEQGDIKQGKYFSQGCFLLHKAWWGLRGSQRFIHFLRPGDLENSIGYISAEDNLPGDPQEVSLSDEDFMNIEVGAFKALKKP
jgi:hypothetical protein